MGPKCKYYRYLEEGRERGFLFELIQGGELFEVLRDRGVFSEMEVRGIIRSVSLYLLTCSEGLMALIYRSILKATRVLHEANIVHCDIK